VVKKKEAKDLSRIALWTALWTDNGKNLKEGTMIMPHRYPSEQR
jgi:hypothetical protein